METTRILAIEDSPTDVRLLRIALESVRDWPTELTAVFDGEDAINYLLHPQTAKPDLAILDLNLPKRDGLEVLQVIRITDYLYGLPVIVLSASTEDAIRARMHDAHLDAECYLRKPSGIAEFIAIGPILRDFYQRVAS